jgi:hypothetical protein
VVLAQVAPHVPVALVAQVKVALVLAVLHAQVKVAHVQLALVSVLPAQAELQDLAHRVPVAQEVAQVLEVAVAAVLVPPVHSVKVAQSQRAASRSAQREKSLSKDKLRA